MNEYYNMMECDLEEDEEIEACIDVVKRLRKYQKSFGPKDEAYFEDPS